MDKNIEVIRKYRTFRGRWLRDNMLRPGDKILVSGSVGDHGIALMSFREGYGFESTIRSDARPLNKMIKRLLNVGGIVAMKDPTRGGLANTLNEWAEKSKVGIMVEEDKIPIKEAVRAASEMLGLDPLTIGNEGKIVIAVVKERTDQVLKALRRTEEGKEAEIIGEVKKDMKGVVLRTLIGGKRIIDTPAGDPIPRIC